MRNTNLISVVRNVQLNIKGKLSNIDILRNELQFLKNFYGVTKFNYVILDDKIVQNYIENVDKLSEDQLTETKVIHSKNNGDKTITVTKKLIECNRVIDGNDTHEVYLIKNALTKDMLSDFQKECAELQPSEYSESLPREIKPRQKKPKTTEKEEPPHKDGKKVVKKSDDKKAAAPAKGKVTTTKGKSTAPPAKGKKPTSKKNEPDPESEPEQEIEPEEAGEEPEDEINDEEPADE